MKTADLARPAAAIVALAAWAGLGLQFQATSSRAATLGATLWILLRFFTVLSNLWLAVQFTGQALGAPRFSSPRAIAGLTVSMMLVGVVYGLLLNGLLELSGGALTADILLHKVTPLLAPLFWLAFTPKGMVRSRDPLLWLIFPVAYLAYALARGVAGDIYAYPFIDVGKLGAGLVATNIAVMGAAYLVGGYAFAALDRWLGRRDRLSRDG